MTICVKKTNRNIITQMCINVRNLSVLLHRKSVGLIPYRNKDSLAAVWEAIIYSEKAIEIYRRLQQNTDTKVKVFEIQDIPV